MGVCLVSALVVLIALAVPNLIDRWREWHKRYVVNRRKEQGQVDVAAKAR
jgi:hypothetical protein